MLPFTGIMTHLTKYDYNCVLYVVIITAQILALLGVVQAVDLMVLVTLVPSLFLPAAAGNLPPLSLQNSLCRKTLRH